jgi:DNA polymerase V
MFALIDCNNFFVSCERLFRPELEGRPVVVLSSNDGCAVSRSGEAKALGIPMGAPAFKIARDFNLISAADPRLAQASAMQGDRDARSEPYGRYGERVRERSTPQRTASGRPGGGLAATRSAAVRDVVSFSANFELYGDISQRLTALLSRVTPKIEIYSVDESFLDLSELNISDYYEWGHRLRERILRDIGIPVSVGIAASKTLAKLANHRAKKDPALAGSLAITNPDNPKNTRYYLETPVEELWGVGWRLTPKLKAHGLHTAEDMRRINPPWARQLMGRHGVQMVAELNGTCCLPLEQGESVHQTIMRGRTLGQEVHEVEPLQAAVANLTARAAFCLRRDNQLVRTASLLLNTNKHKPGYRLLSQTVRFTTPTADTGQICRALVEALQMLHQPALGIYRVNVLFHELVPADWLKLDLFGEVSPTAHDRAQARMAAFDAINDRFGKGHLRFAAEQLSDAWQPRKGACSPRYTTHWDDLPVARLK